MLAGNSDPPDSDPPPPPVKVTDSDRNARDRATYQERKLAGLCTRGCGQPASDTCSMCPTCAVKVHAQVNLANRKRYTERKAAKLCTRCGERRVKAPAVACRPCLGRLGRLPERTEISRSDPDQDPSRDRVIDRDGRLRYLGQSAQLKARRGEARGRLSKEEEIELDVKQIRKSLAQIDAGLVLDGREDEDGAIALMKAIGGQARLIARTALDLAGKLETFNPIAAKAKRAARLADARASKRPSNKR